MAITDLFNNATVSTRPDAGALTAQKLIGAASITVDTTAGWPQTPDAVHFVIYQVDASGNKVAGTQTDWKGLVTSSTAIGTLTLKAGTDQVYPVGSKVIATPTGAWADDMVTGILTHADQDGTLKAGAVDVAGVLASDVVTTAKILDSNVTHAKLALGIPVQMVSTTSATTTSGTTVLPVDNSIPQSGEGIEVMTLAITPKSATNILVIEAGGLLGSSVANNVAMALFQDSVANALYATNQFQAQSGGDVNLSVTHSMVAGTTSATTFKVRVGGNNAGTTTWGNGRFSTTPHGYLKITEYKAS